MAIVTAVLETRPPTAPVTAMPRLSPRRRIATNPTNDNAVTSTTTIQISNGFNTCHGP